MQSDESTKFLLLAAEGLRPGRRLDTVLEALAATRDPIALSRLADEVESNQNGMRLFVTRLLRLTDDISVIPTLAEVAYSGTTEERVAAVATMDAVMTNYAGRVFSRGDAAIAL